MTIFRKEYRCYLSLDLPVSVLSIELSEDGSQDLPFLSDKKCSIPWVQWLTTVIPASW
jgi:hypothetical protein